jgi:hypothetical protein
VKAGWIYFPPCQQIPDPQACSKNIVLSVWIIGFLSVSVPPWEMFLLVAALPRCDDNRPVPFVCRQTMDAIHV